MNRRQFFSFAAVAPVALPMAAKAMAERAPFACGGVAAFRNIKPLAFGYSEWVTPTQVRVSDLVYQLNEGRVRDFAPQLSIAEQFESDLALLAEELDRQGDGTLKSTRDTLS